MKLKLTPAEKYRSIIGIYIVLVLFYGSLFATEITAKELSYQIQLGKPLLIIGYPFNKIFFLVGLVIIGYESWRYFLLNKQRHTIVLVLLCLVGLTMILVGIMPLYPPFSVLSWFVTFNNGRQVWKHTWGGNSVLLSSWLVSIGLGLHLNRIQQKMKLPNIDTYGSAHFATPDEVDATGLKDCNENSSVYMGAWLHPQTGMIHYLRHAGLEHVFAYAPSRSGKGVGLVIPTLLSFSESKLIADFKGENFLLTAGWSKSSGSIVLKFDPTCTDGSAACFNPMFEVRLGIHEVKDVQNIADMLVDPYGKNAQDHWTSAANSLLVSVMLHMLYAEKDKSLTGMRDFLSNPNRTETATFEYMLNTLHDWKGEHHWIDPNTGDPIKTHPIVAAGAREMLNKSEEERSGVMSSALTFLKLYRDPIIAMNTRTSDFSIHDLVYHEKAVSLYLIIPPSDITRVMPLLRLMLNQILARLTENLDFGKILPDGSKRHKLLLQLDEFPQFGRIIFLEKALAYSAGYGIQAYLICQDLTQLYKEYGNYQSILSNCLIRTTYAPNTIETANHISELLGAQTITKEHKHYSGNRLSLYLKNTSESLHETKRQLMTADELMRLEPNAAIIMKNGHSPIYGHKIYYYNDPIFKARASIPPPSSSDKLPVSHPWNNYNIPSLSLSKKSKNKTYKKKTVSSHGDDLL